MPWAAMQVELVPDDMLIRPVVGETHPTREAAHAEVQQLLDQDPQLAPVAEAWRRGAKDDTVYAGLLCWTIIEHGGDAIAAAHAWLTDYADRMRAAGLDVQVARLG